MKAQIIASLFAVNAGAQQVLYSGEGFGTYYYDVQHPQSCGADFSGMNNGNVGYGTVIHPNNKACGI